MAYKGMFRLRQKERCVTHKKQLCSRLERIEISVRFKNNNNTVYKKVGNSVISASKKANRRILWL